MRMWAAAVVACLAIPGGFLADAAAQCPDTTIGGGLDRFGDTHANNWMTNIRTTWEGMDSTHACFPEIDAALEGIQRAYDTCGLWWAPPGAVRYDAGFTANRYSGAPIPLDSTMIMINKRLQNPQATISVPGGTANQHEAVVHEAMHASERPEYHLRSAVNAAYRNPHAFITARANQCYSNVPPPGIGHRVAAVGASAPSMRTGVPWWPGLGMLGIVGLTWIRRRRTPKA